MLVSEPVSERGGAEESEAEVTEGGGRGAGGIHVNFQLIMDPISYAASAPENTIEDLQPLKETSQTWNQQRSGQRVWGEEPHLSTSESLRSSGSPAVQVYRRPQEDIVWRILIDEGGLRSHRDGATLDLALTEG